jgi:hypothetical protein
LFCSFDSSGGNSGGHLYTIHDPALMKPVCKSYPYFVISPTSLFAAA